MGYCDAQAVQNIWPIARCKSQRREDQEAGDETPHAETHYITSCDSQPNGSRTHLREAPGPLHGDAGMVRHNSRGFSLFLSHWSPRNRQHPIQIPSHFSIPGIVCGIP